MGRIEPNKTGLVLGVLLGGCFGRFWWRLASRSRSSTFCFGFTSSSLFTLSSRLHSAGQGYWSWSRPPSDMSPASHLPCYGTAFAVSLATIKESDHGSE
jgi:hypothetical protein